MRTSLLASLFFLLTYPAVSQYKIGPITEFTLPDSLSTGMHEFSDLNIYNDQLVLLPENRTGKPKPFTDGIYTIPLKDIDAQLASSSHPLTYQKHPLIGIQPIQNKITDYQGLEAISMRKNHFYLTVETDETSDSCHIISGKVINNKWIVDSSAIHNLVKPKLRNGDIIFNAGYEALTFYKKNLVSLFEFNYLEQNYAQTSSKKLRAKKPLKLAQKIPFRITGITRLNKKTLVAINYFFPLKAEEVYTKELSSEDELLIAERVPYARLLVLSAKKKQLVVQQSIDLPTEWWRHNWEGIVTHKDGILLINDKFSHPQNQTRLLYIPIQKD